MNILKEIYDRNNQLKCVACGKNVLSLPGDKQENGPIHLFCQMWGHPINQHDYNDPRVWKTKMYENYLKKHNLEGGEI